MQDNLIQKKPIDSNEIIREKNKNKFYYVESKNKKALTHHKENSYGRNGYLIEAQEGDPEFIKDINNRTPYDLAVSMNEYNLVNTICKTIMEKCDDPSFIDFIKSSLFII